MRERAGSAVMWPRCALHALVSAMAPRFAPSSAISRMHCVPNPRHPPADALTTRTLPASVPCCPRLQRRRVAPCAAMDFAAEKKHRQRVLSMCAAARSARRVCSADPRAPRRSFNKGEDDFASAREYDDYLEEVEEIGAPRQRLRRAHAARPRRPSLLVSPREAPLKRPRARSLQPVPAHRRGGHRGAHRGVQGGQRGQHHREPRETGAPLARRLLMRASRVVLRPALAALCRAQAEEERAALAAEEASAAAVRAFRCALCVSRRRPPRHPADVSRVPGCAAAGAHAGPRGRRRR